MSGERRENTEGLRHPGASNFTKLTLLNLPVLVRVGIVVIVVVVTGRKHSQLSWSFKKERKKRKSQC